MHGADQVGNGQTVVQRRRSCTGSTTGGPQYSVLHTLTTPHSQLLFWTECSKDQAHSMTCCTATSLATVTHFCCSLLPLDPACRSIK